MPASEQEIAAAMFPYSLPDPAVEPTMTVDRAAVVLKISRGAAFNAVKNGEIPSIRIGRRVLVPTAPLRRMLGLDDAA